MKAVQAAQYRASISAYLQNNPGERTTNEVAEAIKLSPHSTGQMLKHMASGNLIESNGKLGKQRRWSWQFGESIPDGALAPIPAHKIRTAAPSPKEVELEAFGITIVVGRNENTGRLRIILEG